MPHLAMHSHFTSSGQVISFAVEYSTNASFPKGTTERAEGKPSLFLSDRRMDNGAVGGVYETDIAGLKVRFPKKRKRRHLTVPARFTTNDNNEIPGQFRPVSRPRTANQAECSSFTEKRERRIAPCNE